MSKRSELSLDKLTKNIKSVILKLAIERFEIQ